MKVLERWHVEKNATYFGSENSWVWMFLIDKVLSGLVLKLLAYH